MPMENAAERPPEWDLGDLYASPESPELKRDFDLAEAAATAFAQRYQDRLAEVDGADFGAAIAEYERISELLGRISSYGELTYSGDVADLANGRFYQMIRERVMAISSLTLFFTLQINRLDDATLETKLTAPLAARYRPWLRDVRAFRAHELSDEVERVLHEREVVGRSAWTRLFDETMAMLRFPYGGKDLTITEILNLLSDSNPDTRRGAAQALSDGLGARVRIFTHIINTLAKEKEIDDRWRNYAHPLAFRNLSNHVEDGVVDALVQAVKGAYLELSHRYYAMKARWLGVEHLNHWDRNAPLPKGDDRRYTWDEARTIVLGAYERFSPDLGVVARRFFDHAWIDAEVRPGKASGAFAHPTVPSVHPYLLLNFTGKTRDVMTLAHELGHGIHQSLAAGQGHLMANTPLTLAETASVFGEMLTFRALLDGETDSERRGVMLASKVEDMINTVVRQIAFHEFESAVHRERAHGELSPERLGDLWMQVQSDSLGPVFRFDDGYRHYWTYIPHFIHSPFYVYAYAFGDCLVNSLYAVHEAGPSDFPARYLDLLRAGGTLRHKELLTPFGLDATDPGFWQRGLNVVSGLIDELEKVR
ncbi:MAG: M3 family oligoendopeptidase [Alphaproteobacteria bacterium]|nr:M3 family oligoendopeptidase [Alphaproteobacteria bacterium]